MAGFSIGVPGAKTSRSRSPETIIEALALAIEDRPEHWRRSRLFGPAVLLTPRPGGSIVRQLQHPFTVPRTGKGSSHD